MASSTAWSVVCVLLVLFCRLEKVATVRMPDNIVCSPNQMLFPVIKEPTFLGCFTTAGTSLLATVGGNVWTYKRKHNGNKKIIGECFNRCKVYNSTYFSLYAGSGEEEVVCKCLHVFFTSSAIDPQECTRACRVGTVINSRFCNLTKAVQLIFSMENWLPKITSMRAAPLLPDWFNKRGLQPNITVILSTNPRLSAIFSTCRLAQYSSHFTYSVKRKPKRMSLITYLLNTSGMKILVLNTIEYDLFINWPNDTLLVLAGDESDRAFHLKRDNRKKTNFSYWTYTYMFIDHGPSFTDTEVYNIYNRAYNKKSPMKLPVPGLILIMIYI